MKQRVRGKARKPLIVSVFKSASEDSKRRFRADRNSAIPEPLHPENCPDPLYADYLYETGIDRMFIAAWDRLRRDLCYCDESVRRNTRNEVRRIVRKPENVPMMVYLAARVNKTPAEIAAEIPKTAKEAKERGPLPAHRGRKHRDRGNVASERSNRDSAKRYD